MPLQNKASSIGTSSELRKQEHADSYQFHVDFDGTMETCPYKVGDIYNERPIIAIGLSSNVYGQYYHIIVERDKTHLRMKFQFDQKHDLKFAKPVERMGKQPTEGEIKKLLAQTE
jgi:hypothetical protein